MKTTGIKLSSLMAMLSMASSFSALSGLPRTGNQRRMQREAAQGVGFSRFGFVQHTNPKRNAERAQLKADRAAARLRGTVPYQQNHREV